MGFFKLLQEIISTRLPSNSLINLEDTTNNGYYTARARRMSPRTQIDSTLDSTSILIPSSVTAEGRADFLAYNSILDSVAVFVIEYSNHLLSQSDGIYVIPEIFSNGDERGLLLTNTLRVESLIQMMI